MLGASQAASIGERSSPLTRSASMSLTRTGRLQAARCPAFPVAVSTAGISHCQSPAETRDLLEDPRHLLRQMTNLSACAQHGTSS
jgi:hypothetical protein